MGLGTAPALPALVLGDPSSRPHPLSPRPGAVQGQEAVVSEDLSATHLCRESTCSTRRVCSKAHTHWVPDLQASWVGVGLQSVALEMKLFFLVGRLGSVSWDGSGQKGRTSRGGVVPPL